MYNNNYKDITFLGVNFMKFIDKNEKKLQKEIKTHIKKIEKAHKKLNKDIRKNASQKIIEKDNYELLLLLGECNYLIKEFHLYKKAA